MQAIYAVAVYCAYFATFWCWFCVGVGVCAGAGADAYRHLSM